MELTFRFRWSLKSINLLVLNCRFILSGLNFQVLTLQASNMTSDNLTLTVLAPASFTSPPSVVPLSSSPSSPLRSFSAPAVLAEGVNGDRQGSVLPGLSPVSLDQGHKEGDEPPSVSVNDRTLPLADVVPNSDLGCTHLWLQSRVPLGYVISMFSFVSVWTYWATQEPISLRIRCVPSQSTATVKLEVLPLTDGIITLDSLQIEVKEKGK